MKKARQIIALIGVILLVLLYVSTLVLAIVDKSSSMKLFPTSVIATIIVPVLIWTVTFFMKRNRDDIEEQFKDDSDESK